MRKGPGVEPGEHQHLKRGQRGLGRSEQRARRRNEIVVSWKLKNWGFKKRLVVSNFSLVASLSRL